MWGRSRRRPWGGSCVSPSALSIWDYRVDWSSPFLTMAFLPETLSPGCPPLLLPASLASLLLRRRAITRTYSGPVPKLVWDSQIFHFWFRIQISKAEVMVLIWNKLLWASESRRRPLKGRKRESDRRMDRERAGRRKDEGEGIFGPSEGIRALCVCVREKDREERKGWGRRSWSQLLTFIFQFYSLCGPDIILHFVCWSVEWKLENFSVLFHQFPSQDGLRMLCV